MLGTIEVKGVSSFYFGTSERELKILELNTKTEIDNRVLPDPETYFDVSYPNANGHIKWATASPDKKYLAVSGDTNYIIIYSHCSNSEIIQPDLSCVSCTTLDDFEKNKDQCNRVIKKKIFSSFTFLQTDPCTREKMTFTLRVQFDKEIEALTQFTGDNINANLAQIIQFYTVQENERIDIPQDKVMVTVGKTGQNRIYDIKFQVTNFTFDKMDTLKHMKIQYEFGSNAFDLTKPTPENDDFTKSLQATPLRIISPIRSDFSLANFWVEFTDLPNISLNTIISNSYTKAVLISILITAFIGQGATAMRFYCLNIGTGFVKFFQIIEILGKFLFIPVSFNKELRDLLYSINNLGEVIELPPTFIIKKKKQQQIEQNRYWYKLTHYGEYKNILQSCLFQVGTMIILVLLDWIFIFFAEKWQFKNKYFKQLKALAHDIKVLFIQGALVDVSFSGTFNLLGSFEYTELTQSLFIGKVVSILGLSIIISELLCMFRCAYKNPKELPTSDFNFLSEGLNESTFKKYLTIRQINVIFQMKLYVMITIIIICQKWAELCLISLLLLQILQLVLIYKSTKGEHEWVFKNCISFSSFYLVEIALTGFIIGSIVIHIFSKFTVGSDSFLKTMSYILMATILLSILVDFIQLIFDLFKELLQNLKHKTKKRRKIAPHPKFLTLDPTNKLDKSRLLKIKLKKNLSLKEDNQNQNISSARNPIMRVNSQRRIKPKKYSPFKKLHLSKKKKAKNSNKEKKQKYKISQLLDGNPEEVQILTLLPQKNSKLLQNSKFKPAKRLKKKRKQRKKKLTDKS